MRAEGAYELLNKIGSGSTSEVFLARLLLTPAASDTGESLFAVKIVRPDMVQRPGYRDALDREKAIAVTFTHHAACKVFEIDRTRDGGTMIAMEHLHGQTLGNVLHRASTIGAKLPPELVAWIGLMCAQALYGAHK